jgi:hypothetical protein
LVTGRDRNWIIIPECDVSEEEYDRSEIKGMANATGNEKNISLSKSIKDLDLNLSAANY